MTAPIAALLFCPRVQSHKIDAARLALCAARNARAGSFAPNQFREAERASAAMLTEWQRQNKRIFLVRNFRRTTDLARETDSLARLSRHAAMVAQDSFQSAAPICYAALSKSLEEFGATFGSLPMPLEQREHVTRAELLLAEGKDALLRGDYALACDRFSMAQGFLDDVSLKERRTMGAYVTRLPVWLQWAQQTQTWSVTHHRPAIIIDKMAHSLSLYQNGKLAMTMPVELGANWIGDKAHRGDRATPEGRYFIRGKKSPTIYHKALEIDYPNAEDRKLFALAQRHKTAGSPSSLGGDIEIHGGGGKQCDWTEGCVALRNEDIDKLYALVGLATPVTIVGTLNRPLAESFQASPGKKP